jgi:chemotaxis protein CheZ
VEQKVFRIEKMPGGGRDQSQQAYPGQAADRPADVPMPATTVERELASLREAIACNKRELAALIEENGDRRMTRAASELGAAVEGMETATQKILASAETIDDCARTLASALTHGYHHGLAQDMQEHVVRIYEACNFQDLAGQRIGKVIATLIMVEERLVAMIAHHQKAATAESTHATSKGLVNGPRLDGAAGHVSQHDIDLMFA